MTTSFCEIKVRGQVIKVPSTCIDNKTVVVTGKWIKMAAVHDEIWLEGQCVSDPELFIAELKRRKVKADIFTFEQRPPDTQPRYDYHVEWDNVAAAPSLDFKAWWDSLPQESRKNVRRFL